MANTNSPTSGYHVFGRANYRFSVIEWRVQNQRHSRQFRKLADEPMEPWVAPGFHLLDPTSVIDVCDGRNLPKFLPPYPSSTQHKCIAQRRSWQKEPLPEKQTRFLMRPLFEITTSFFKSQNDEGHHGVEIVLLITFPPWLVTFCLFGKTLSNAPSATKRSSRRKKNGYYPLQ